jgi:cytosine/creatinine deaminase
MSTPAEEVVSGAVPMGGITEMDLRFMAEARDEAKAGLAEGGIPIGSVLVVDGTIVGRGHNMRIQKSSPVLHAEMSCLENAGRLTAKQVGG